MGQREFERIDRHLRPLVVDMPGARNLADDAALLDALPADEQLVVTTDAMVEGVHFLPDIDPGLLARKLLRVNLSDLAAMGAEPLGYSLVLGLPRRIGEAWIAAFVAGLAADQQAFGLPLTGGDSVSTPGPIMLSVTALGRVPIGLALGRSGAQVGDQIWVTGTLGDARLALAYRLAKTEAEAPPPPRDPAHADALATRLDCPSPRLSAGQALRGRATAALDISDGLGGDLGHILTASAVGAVLDLEAIPLSPAVRDVLDQAPAWRQTVLSGGDDYELLFTAPPGRAPPAVPGVAMHRIGEITAAPQTAGADRLTTRDGQPLTAWLGGWDHYAP